MGTHHASATAAADDNATTQSPLLLTIAEAATMLRVGRSTAYELIGRGELEVVHIGRAARVPLAAVVDLVERLRRRAADPRSLRA